MKLYSTWNIQGSCKTISIQERYLKYKPISTPIQRTAILDKVEARSAWFTELESYWCLPLTESGTVAALSVSSGSKGDGTDDKIRVLTANPLCLYNMSVDSENLQEIDLQGFVNTLRGNKPHFSLSNDRTGNILVHEATVSISDIFYLFLSRRNIYINEIF